jgi:hypothetical protein
MLRRSTTCFSLLMLFCFLVTSLSFRPVSAEEGMIKATVKKKKVETIQEEPQSSEEQPTISFENTTYDAGEVWEGNIVTHTFTVKNTGTALLTIKNVKPG